MDMDVEPSLWDKVLKLTKSAQEKNINPLVWAIQLNSTLNTAGVSLPSVELAHLLVSHICWDNHVPIAWKFLEKALMIKIVPPIILLPLLSSRVIPCRKMYPSAYRLYIELLKRHVFPFTFGIKELKTEEVMKSIDDVLRLSHIFGIHKPEPGLLLVGFVFSAVWQLLDASLDDEGLLEPTAERMSRWPSGSDDMDIDNPGCPAKRVDHLEGMQKGNTTMAIEVIGEFLQSKTTSRILYLARQNMSSLWEDFTQKLRVLASKSVALRNSKHISPESLLHSTYDAHSVGSKVRKTVSCKEFHVLMASGSQLPPNGHCHGSSQSSLWLPIDLFVEDAMDGSQVSAVSATEKLTGLVTALQAINGTTWHDTFLGLWIAVLRLVQRERDPSEGPVPRLDTCLCMLLSIAPLAIANIIEEEESEWIDKSKITPTNQQQEQQTSGKRRKGLVTSLQQLGDYESLLTPPQSVRLASNKAMAKANIFTSINTYNGSVSLNDMPNNCCGNMRHLIVEACIARNLVDTSSYLWPGYVNMSNDQVLHGVSGELPGWSALMNGSPLTPSLTNELVETPASSLAEIERIYEIAINGSDDDKIAAATILCGASLVCGWSIQEHVIIFIARLLLTPVPANHQGSDSHMIGYAQLLNVLLAGMLPVDCVQIFSLHGLVPILVGALVPICETFGSSIPNTSWSLPTGEEFSCHFVFSNAFTLLMRLWRFDHPPVEHVLGDVPPVGSQPSPEYLLLVRNSCLASFGKSPKNRMKSKIFSELFCDNTEPIFMDSFPKFKSWYRQHQECIASTLSELESGDPVHQIVDSLINMMFRKSDKGGQSLTSPSSGSCNSCASGIEDASSRLNIPAWDVLKATPFALSTALAACAHGKLSPRELVTGLKNLADFLPATLVSIVSYFSAEVTRGVWKPATMNGTDWPSPAANLAIVEQQIKKILAATGVNVPSLTIGGSSPATLPLPLAALVSLTITYKLDKLSERFLASVAPALNFLAVGCPWPSMPIVASLWVQKVKRWSDFLVFSASRTVFHHNNDAVVQLIKSCFTSTLGLSTPHVYNNGGVGALLGHGFGSNYSGGISPVAPGILYLRVHRSVRDFMFITEEILSALMVSVRSIASIGLTQQKLDKSKKTKYKLRYGQVSLAPAMVRVKLAASLGASLIWVSGGVNLVQRLLKETLPSWFLSVHKSEEEDFKSSDVVARLSGSALAYLAIFCGTFAWGVNSTSRTAKRRPNVLKTHLEFIVSALDGKIPIGCDSATWRAYVSGLVSLMVGCTPTWVMEVEVNLLKRLSKGLERWDEDELALALLGIAGVDAMGEAAQLILKTTV